MEKSVLRESCFAVPFQNLPVMPDTFVNGKAFSELLKGRKRNPGKG